MGRSAAEKHNVAVNAASYFLAVCFVPCCRALRLPPLRAIENNKQARQEDTPLTLERNVETRDSERLTYRFGSTVFVRASASIGPIHATTERGITTRKARLQLDPQLRMAKQTSRADQSSLAAIAWDRDSGSVRVYH